MNDERKPKRRRRQPANDQASDPGAAGPVGAADKATVEALTTDPDAQEAASEAQPIGPARTLAERERNDFDARLERMRGYANDAPRPELEAEIEARQQAIAQAGAAKADDDASDDRGGDSARRGRRAAAKREQNRTAKRRVAKPPKGAAPSRAELLTALQNATTPPAIVAALVRLCGSYRDVASADLAAWLHECPEPDRIAAVNLLSALFDGPAWWSLDPAHPERPTVAAQVWAPITMEERDSGSVTWPAWRALEEVHAGWLALPEPRPDHPLQPIVAAYLRRRALTAAKIDNASDAKAQTAGGLVRVPYAVNEVIRRRWEPTDEVTAVTVDGEPLTARIQEPQHNTDWLYVDDPRSWPDSDGNLMLPDHSFGGVYPQRARNMPLTMVAQRNFRVADRRSSIKNDLRTVLTVTFAASRPVVWSDERGARLLARTSDGGYRTPRDSDRDRWQAAYTAGDSIRLYYWRRNRSTPSWVRVMIADPYLHEGRIALAPPAWYRERKAAEEQIGGRMGYTLTGGAHPARMRGGGSAAYSLVVSSMEYWLARSFEGDDENVAPLLRPVSRGGAGPWETMRWYEALEVLALDRWNRQGQSDNEQALRRYWRIVEGLHAAGYMNLGEAGNGDVVECRASPRMGRRSGRSAPWLSFRATARFCEAARLATAGRWQTVPLLDWYGAPETAE